MLHETRAASSGETPEQIGDAPIGRCHERVGEYAEPVQPFAGQPDSHADRQSLAEGARGNVDPRQDGNMDEVG